MDTKTCTKCGETKPLAAFNKKPRGKHGVSATCKSCQSRYDAARHEKNPRKGASKTPYRSSFIHYLSSIK